ncbi:hypothetical protein [Sphingomonas sp. DT-51]|uniref:hypothetical protein n=1 Tax=Sphingomonas sp. DT-51 TaxID=3396165 RepID=UPI003F5413F1
MSSLHAPYQRAADRASITAGSQWAIQLSAAPFGSERQHGSVILASAPIERSPQFILVLTNEGQADVAGGAGT